MATNKLAITLVCGDDWTGLYIDDQLVTENHTLPARLVLEMLAKRKLLTFKSLVPDQDWLEGEGSLPPMLGDVLLENGKRPQAGRGLT